MSAQPPDSNTFVIDTGKKVFEYPTKALRDQALPRIRRTCPKAQALDGNDALNLLARTPRDLTVDTSRPAPPPPRIQLEETPRAPKQERYPAKKAAFKRPRPTRRW